jgi:hypothetical protein
MMDEISMEEFRQDLLEEARMDAFAEQEFEHMIRNDWDYFVDYVQGAICDMPFDDAIYELRRICDEYGWNADETIEAVADGI